MRFSFIKKKKDIDLKCTLGFILFTGSDLDFKKAQDEMYNERFYL